MAGNELHETLTRIDTRLANLDDKLDRIDRKVDRGVERTDLIVSRIDVLVDTTNHRLDDFREALDGKLDNAELLTSFGFHVMNNRVIRWVVGGALAAFAATTTYHVWSGAVLDFLTRLF